MLRHRRLRRRHPPRHDLLYAEGIAVAPFGPGTPPLAHGWCATTDGRALDVTWDYHPDTLYYGIAFTDPAAWPYDDGGLLTEPTRILPLLRDGIPEQLISARGYHV